MKKLESLRKHLAERIPGLPQNPERLLTFIEDGAIEFHRGPTLSHQYSIPVHIVLTDYSGELDAVVIPLLQWLSHYQPDLKPEEAVTFQAELLQHNAWDLAFRVLLTERVVAKMNCDEGKIEIEHRMPGFEINPCGPSHWQLYLQNGEPGNYALIAEWDEPS